MAEHLPSQKCSVWYHQVGKSRITNWNMLADSRMTSKETYQSKYAHRAIVQERIRLLHEAVLFAPSQAKMTGKWVQGIHMEELAYE